MKELKPLPIKCLECLEYAVVSDGVDGVCCENCENDSFTDADFDREKE